MYIPPNCKPMSEYLGDYAIKLVLQGRSATGKSTGALTFPNVIYANLDLPPVGLPRTAHEAPFRDESWVKSFYKSNDKYPVSGAFIQWLTTEAKKLTAEQTLVVDSWTALQSHFDRECELHPVFSIKGEVNEYKFWDKKLDYSELVCDTLKDLACNVVLTVHEQETRNGQGTLLSKIGPLMQGSFPKQMGRYFTDWFRCVSKDKKDSNGNLVDTEFFWQTKSDDSVDLKTRLKNAPRLIEPNYSVFKEYVA